MAKFLAKVTDGQLNFGSGYNQARFNQWLKECEGKWVSIGRPESKRSTRQNAYYWAYLTIIGHETGNVPEDLHECFKERFMAKRKVVVWGRQNNFRFQTPVSTTKLTKVEFGEYLEKICALTEVPLPDPTQLEGYLPG